MTLGSIGSVKTASAIEPHLTEEEAKAANRVTYGIVGVGVNEEGRGKVLGVGFATDGNEGTGTGGILGAGFGGDAEGSEDGGTGTGTGGILAFGHGGDAKGTGQGGGGGVAKSAPLHK